MNPRLPCALFIALLAVTAAPAATFEGKVEMKMTSNGRPAQTMVYQIRDGQMRIDIPTASKQGGVSMIMDTGKQQMMIIMPAQKMYMTRSLAASAAPAGYPAAAPDMSGPGPSAEAATVPPIAVTTEHATILGYDCVKYTTTSKTDGSVTQLWVTDQLGNFAGLGGMTGGSPAGRMGMGPPPTPQPWEKALMGKGFFPLRVVGTDSSGKEKFRLEVTSVAKQTLSDSLFSPPDGYRELNMGNIMGGMMPH